MKIRGDKVASIATPIARALKLPCIDPNTQELRPESPCAKAKQRLNQGESFWDVMYDRFWSSKNIAEAFVDETPETTDSKANMEDYLVNKNITEQVAVKAASLQDAENRVAKGEGEIIVRNTTVSSRPRPTKPTVSGGQLPSN